MMLLVTFSLSTYAKRDIDAWKQETTLECQFSVFKENLNVWQDYMSFKEPQINQLFSAIKDSINILETKISTDKKTLSQLNANISELNSNLSETKSKLEDDVPLFNHDVNDKNGE